MYQSPNRGHIRPKFSSMPRQRSEAAAFLDSYKLSVEKRRLQQELDSLNQRRDQIAQRLNAIEQQVEKLGTKTEQSGTVYDADQSQRPIRRLNQSTSDSDSESFNTLFVDY